MGIRYTLRRVLGLIPTLFGVITLTFLLVSAVPGDPAFELAGSDATPERVASIRHSLGLDRPLLHQYLTYLDHLLHGSLGTSFTQSGSVRTVIAQRMGPTLLLTGAAFALSTLFGLALGIFAARQGGGAIDGAIGVVSILALATPAFWLGQLAVLGLALHLKLFPIQGYADVRHVYTGRAHLDDVAYHLMLPALVLAFSELAYLTRITRSGLLRELGSDYVRTARAKGLAESRVVEHHALRNVMLPFVTVLGTRIGFLLSGSVVIESVFAWPGLGTVLTQAAKAKDQEMVTGVVLVVAVGVLLANLIVDLVYVWVDPRVRDA